MLLNTHPTTMQPARASRALGRHGAFQHVNNVQYFKYFESVRIAYFDQIGFTEAMDHQSVGPISPRPAAAFAFRFITLRPSRFVREAR